MSPELQEIFKEQNPETLKRRLIASPTLVIDEFLVEHSTDSGLRRVIRAERDRRSIERLATPHQVFWWSLVVMIVTMILAAIAAWPVIRSWFPPH